MQLYLFDGHLRHRKCCCCRRRLHNDPKRLYRTRELALCFRCVAEWERSPIWSVENFVRGKLAERSINDSCDNSKA